MLPIRSRGLLGWHSCGSSDSGYWVDGSTSVLFCSELICCCDVVGWRCKGQTVNRLFGRRRLDSPQSKHGILKKRLST